LIVIFALIAALANRKGVFHATNQPDNIGGGGYMPDGRRGWRGDIQL
jgi:hypothetical protein